MAALIRHCNRLARTSLTTSQRAIQRFNSSEILPKDSTEDDPIVLDNPYEKEKRQCTLCRLNIEPDYKNVRLLSQFQSVYTGRIYGIHITGLCRAKQKRVEEEILKAQNAGLMGYYQKDVRYANDPKLFDPNNPFRPHKY